MTKILYPNLESSTRVSSALLEFGVTWRNVHCATLVYLRRQRLRVMSPMSGDDGLAEEYRLETGSRHIAFKRLLNVY